jgi:5'-nucleotidase (lipoprotein e(P4) family)
MKKYTILILLFLFACSDNVKQEKEKLPNDIRWVTNSSEYKILCQQIYNNATINLLPLINKKNIKYAVVMDLDETVLDNSDYQINLVENNLSFTQENWSEWVNQANATLVPGAKEFISALRQYANIQIIFLSNRMHVNLEPTINNMKKLNIVDEKDIFLLRKDKADKKNIRRDEIILGKNRMVEVGPMQIIGYFGDATHDFPKEDKFYKFGSNMFMFPNPMYGKW